MEKKDQQTCGGVKVWIFFFVFLWIALASSVLTLVISKHFFEKQLCGAPDSIPDVSSKSSLFKKDKEEWDVATDRIESRNGKYVITSTQADERCYIMPKEGAQQESNVPKPLILINHPLPEELIRETAGEEGVEFCAGLTAFLLRVPTEEELYGTAKSTKVKRDAPKPEIDLEAPEVLPKDGRDYQGMALPYSQRQPRCMDVVLDCSKDGAVGESQTCYTWTNGILRMTQTCIEPNKFTIHMTKLPGRMIKIAQKQMIKCIVRRRFGLRC